MSYAVQKEVRDRHREAMEKKYHRIGMLKALLEEWEPRDPEYARDLRRRLHSVELQLKAMNP
jgi:hypothetical protein